MLLEVFLATAAVALLSIVGILCFGANQRLDGIERYVVPAAVGVFMALVFVEIIPEVMHEAEVLGGIAISLSFIAVYALAHLLHRRLHSHSIEHNDKQEAAVLVLFGDALHNFADGVIIAGAFFISPEVGVATALAIALHEFPQEIVEFGVLIKAGYTKTQALWRNLLSASTVVVGGLVTVLFGTLFGEWMWLLMAFVAGNLLYVAASELLPRLHGSRQVYGSLEGIMVAMLLGYGVTAGAIVWAHENILPAEVHNHALSDEVHEDHSDHDHETDTLFDDDHHLDDDHDHAAELPH